MMRLSEGQVNKFTNITKKLEAVCKANIGNPEFEKFIGIINTAKNTAAKEINIDDLNNSINFLQDKINKLVALIPFATRGEFRAQIDKLAEFKSEINQNQNQKNKTASESGKVSLFTRATQELYKSFAFNAREEHLKAKNNVSNQNSTPVPIASAQMEQLEEITRLIIQSYSQLQSEEGNPIIKASYSGTVNKVTKALDNINTDPQQLITTLKIILDKQPTSNAVAEKLNEARKGLAKLNEELNTSLTHSATNTSPRPTM